MGLPVVGLTGGIASGKSTVARALAKRGAAVVDADQLAREVVQPGTEGLAEIVAAFGPEVLTAEGHLDRKALGARVFEDQDARRTLNGITHPRIAQAAMRRLAELQDSGAPYVVYEAALLVENGAYRTMSALIVVALDPELQQKRLLNRDGLPEQDASARIRSQAPLQAKLDVADYVIHNHGNLEDLEAQVDGVHRALLERFAGGERTP